MEEIIMHVKRGNGIWLAPEPLARWAGTMPGIRWVPVDDASGFQLSAVWTADAPSDLIARMIAEARAAAGSTDRSENATRIHSGQAQISA